MRGAVYHLSLEVVFSGVLDEELEALQGVSELLLLLPALTDHLLRHFRLRILPLVLHRLAPPSPLPAFNRVREDELALLQRGGDRASRERLLGRGRPALSTLLVQRNHFFQLVLQGDLLGVSGERMQEG